MANRGSFGSYDPGYGSSGQQRGEGGGGGGGGGGGANEFLRLTQVVATNIQKVTNNVGQLQRMVKQIGTSQDSPELRDKMHQVQHYTNQLAKETGRHLRDIAHLHTSGPQSEQKQRRIQHERLMNEFTSALNSLQGAQREAASRERQSVARARAHSSVSSTDPFRESADEQLVNLDRSSGAAGFDDAFSAQPPVSQQQQVMRMEEDVDLQLLQEREQSIKQLESDIMDVNQIFKDLGMLVHEQGEVIDSIEANVDAAQVQVQEGTSQLQKARNYQSASRRKKCILLIILLVVLIIIGVIIYVSVKN